MIRSDDGDTTLIEYFRSFEAGSIEAVGNAAPQYFYYGYFRSFEAGSIEAAAGRTRPSTAPSVFPVFRGRQH